MKVFQFFFNPKAKENFLCDCFSFEPESIYEKRLGFIYTVGTLKNVLPQNQDFLAKISRFIKEKYYQKNLLKPEKALKETLKEANEFLSEIAKKGDVSWLGNLSLAVLNLKDFNINFTKVGEIKIYLIRGKKIIDIDKKLNINGLVEPYPLKIFGNVVSGKLAEGDLILVLTKEVLEFFQNENVLDELKNVHPFDDEVLKEMLEKKKEKLLQINGICFLIYLVKELKGESREVIASSNLKEFTLKEVFFTLFSRFLSKKEEKKEFSFRQIFAPLTIRIRNFLKKTSVLLLLYFILILMIGYLIFR